MLRRPEQAGSKDVIMEKRIEINAMNPNSVNMIKQEKPAYYVQNKSVNNLIPFPNSPPQAAECKNNIKEKYFYAQGVEGKQCVEKCPGPTLPDTKGHCRAGLSSA